MTDDTENIVKIEEEVVEKKEEAKEEVTDFVPQVYSQHGGDPRELDISFCVMVSGLPTDFMADTYDQFSECIKNMLSEEYKLDSATLKQIIRIPKLESNAADQSNALRVLLCFKEKSQKHRMMGRKKEFEANGMRVESLDELPAELLEISDDEAKALQNHPEDVSQQEEHEEDVDDEEEEAIEEVDEVEEEDDLIMETENGEDEHEEDHDDEDVEKKEGEEETSEKKKENDNKKDSKKEEKKRIEAPKKKVYEDEDEKAPFEMSWEGAPEFQWRLCDNAREEKKLIIDNLLWSDLNNVFIYRTMQKATTCELSFPTRFNSDGNRPCYGKMTLFFPGFVAIMDEALKHLIYFRCGDGRRLKVFLPQTTASLKRKDEFEGKLGRLIKPTQRMMELVIKILPEDFAPSLDDACAWFPYQSVIGCDLVNDEMGKPCAIVKFETAEEAVAAHGAKSFVTIVQTVTKKDSEGKEKEETVKTNCNVFMRGVEAHFGSLLTFFDQKKKAQEQRSNRRKSGPGPIPSQKRPAGSMIRGPAQKKRAASPPIGRPGNPRHSKDTTPRGRGGRIGGSGGGSGGPRRSSPPSRTTPRGGARGGARGGRSDRGGARSAPRSSYRNDSFSSSSHRGPARTEAFSGYGYAQFDNRYGGNDRPSVDPFGRPVYGSSAFGGSSSSFHRDDSNSRSNNFQSFSDRRRY